MGESLPHSPSPGGARDGAFGAEYVSRGCRWQSRSPVRCGYLPQPTEKRPKIVGFTFFYLGLDKVFFRYGE